MSETIREYKCPNCGAPLTFDGDSQTMRCSSCDSKFSISDYEAISMIEGADNHEETDWNVNQDKPELSSYRTYVCPSCGGEIFADETTSATQCPYCGNPTIIEQQLSGIYMPDGIIPFKTTKTDAINALESFYNKFLVPSDFKSNSRIENIQGVYVPFWLFDCTVNGSVTFNATNSNSWRQGDYIYTKRSHYLLVRRGNMDFKKIPMDGLKKMDDEFMQSIEPFNYRDITDFKDTYLSGYLADKYDVLADDCVPVINQRVRETTRDAFRATAIGYDSVTTRSSNININNGNISYVLMPVWILNTIWQGQKFTFMMNGQTKEVIGDLPCDKGKAIITWILIALAGLAITALIYFGYR